MTTVAWDGETLAGDCLMNHNGTPTRTRKVFRLIASDRRVRLIGLSGHAGDNAEYMRWARGEADRPLSFKELRVIVIDDKRRIWQTDENMHWLRIIKKNWAIGSGADFAMGAMAAGKTAIEAVGIGSKLDIHTGMGFQRVAL